MVIIIASVIYWIIVLLYEVCTGHKTKKTRTKLHWSKIQAQKKKKVKVKEKQKVKIILMGGGRQEKPPPTTSKNPFLPSKLSKIKKKHVAKGAEKLPEPEAP